MQVDSSMDGQLPTMEQQPARRVRLKVEFDEAIDLGDLADARRILLPLPPGLTLVRELAAYIRQRVAAAKLEPLLLALDGFVLPPSEQLCGLVRDGDLLMAREASAPTTRSSLPLVSTPPPAKRSRVSSAATDALADRGSLAGSPPGECSPGLVAALDVALAAAEPDDAAAIARGDPTSAPAAPAACASVATEVQEAPMTKRKDRGSRRKKAATSASGGAAAETLLSSDAAAALAAAKARALCAATNGVAAEKAEREHEAEVNAAKARALEKLESDAAAALASAKKAASEKAAQYAEADRAAAQAAVGTPSAKMQPAAEEGARNAAASAAEKPKLIVTPGGLGGIKCSEDGTTVYHPIIGELEVMPAKDGRALMERKLRTLGKAVVRQVEFYFTRFEQDEFMQENLDEVGYLPIVKLATFERLSHLTTDVPFIADSLADSATVQVSPCGGYVRPRQPGEAPPAARPAPTSAERSTKVRTETIVVTVPARDVVDEATAAVAANAAEEDERHADAVAEEVFKVFVGGLPYACTEDVLQKDFSECGKIQDLVMPKEAETGRSRGIAFITFETQAGMEAALKYDGSDYGGRAIKVKKDEKRKGKGKGGKDKDMGKGKAKGKKGGKAGSAHSVVIKGLSYEASEDDLRTLFKSCGSGPTNVKLLMDANTGRSRGTAFVDFDGESGVEAALKLNDTPFKGRSFYVNYSQPRSA
eukprot:TRINITY_DN6698_c0_g1_i2.p1 TRINITY_DN6698_c0_g1~~TRINITY_DN6698_c0_g1_i2.p1  ORF type:complete len:707 (-),score=194.25 TRINITY_DN6698_c0_g1_i2:235-2355(-)